MSSVLPEPRVSAFLTLGREGGRGFTGAIEWTKKR